MTTHSSFRMAVRTGNRGVSVMLPFHQPVRVHLAAAEVWTLTVEGTKGQLTSFALDGEEFPSDEVLDALAARPPSPTGTTAVRRGRRCRR